MTVKRPRIPSFNNYDFETDRYVLLDGRQAIQRIMAGEEVLVSSRWDARNGSRGRPLRLNQLLRYNHIYPEGRKWTQFDYWGSKTARNLTEEDKSYLRWLIRQGKLRDAPIKEKDY